MIYILMYIIIIFEEKAREMVKTTINNAFVVGLNTDTFLFILKVQGISHIVS